MRPLGLVILSLSVVVAVAALMRENSAVSKDTIRGPTRSGRSKVSASAKAIEREKKILSIFSIVRFANLPCTSTSAFTKAGGTTFRNGTCFTSVECSNKGGTSAGNCAGGFGVCCVFTASATGTSTNTNCTYIQNPGFPAVYGDTAGLAYTVTKCDCDVCFLRLDFECFTTVGPGIEDAGAGTCQTDTFVVTTTSGFTIPEFCGQNTGQHMYLDMGGGCTDSATLTFAFTGASTVRTWEIKLSQIPCGSNFTPPNGCLQYHVDLDGRFTTFNFLDTATNHLGNQMYSICIRQAEGFCCVQYAVCNNDNGNHALSLEIAMSMTDAVCLMADQDYLIIEDSSNVCMQGGIVGVTKDLYCGMFLNTFDGSVVDTTICDCTAPFEVDVRTDPGTGMQGRGTCLEYTQIPCA